MKASNIGPPWHAGEPSHATVPLNSWSFFPACSLKDFIYFKPSLQKYNSIFQVQLARLLTKPLYALWPHKLHAIARQRDSWVKSVSYRLSPCRQYTCCLSICRLSVCLPVAWLPAACLPVFLPYIKKRVFWLTEFLANRTVKQMSSLLMNRNYFLRFRFRSLRFRFRWRVTVPTVPLPVPVPQHW